MQKIIPSLWFDDNCEEAMKFYTSAFPNFKITNIRYYPEESNDPHLQGMNGKILHGEFELAGFRFTSLDGGPILRFNPSVSFMLNFDPAKDNRAAENLQIIWDKLISGGEVMMGLGEYPHSKKYGWLKDKYGLTWQLMLANPDEKERPFITPALLFTGAKPRAETAIKYYLSIFQNSTSGQLQKYDESQIPNMAGRMMFADFKLENQWFVAMDGGEMHDFAFNEAISFTIACTNQAEIDYYWNKLSAVSESEQCGWCKDKFGVSWQVIPKNMSDPIKTPAAMDAMMKMKKIDTAALETLA